MLLPLALTAALALPAQAADWPDLSGPPSATSRDGSRDAALVIAIEDYAFAQDLPGAVANGKDWVTWLKDAHGVPLVKPLFNQQAAKEDLLAEVRRVAARVKPGGRLWVVYIGHGAPSESGQDGLLVGVDARQTPSSLEARGVPRGVFLDAAEEALPAGAEIVLVQDACFSGKTSRGDLAPGMAPLKAVTARLGAQVTVLSAARSDEYAGPLSDGTRPAFSYLVLGALRGWGDRDGDGRVTAAEAVHYADGALVQTTTGRSQTPELSGADVALARSGREAGPDLADLAMTVAAGSSAVGPVSAGQVDIDLGGQATDFAALAAQAEAADRAAAAASRRKAEAAEALRLERRRRLDAAKAQVQASAARDFAAIEGLVANPTENSRSVLQAWLTRYGSATVTIDGVTEAVEVAMVARVEQALNQRHGSENHRQSPSGIEWVRIPGGTYQMGSNNGDSDEKPVHSVRVSSFELMKTEVTVGQYRTCVEAGACTAPKGKSSIRYCNWGWSGREDHPVNCVDWDQAQAFAKWAGGRLPTEAEWEYGARSGGKSWRYPWGDEEATCRLAIMDDGSDGCGQVRTWPVCSKPAGNSSHGVCDLAGNVREWVQDGYLDTYRGAPGDGRAWEDGASRRVGRGGSWRSTASGLRASNRHGSVPSLRNITLGFRLAR